MKKILILRIPVEVEVNVELDREAVDAIVTSMRMTKLVVPSKEDYDDMRNQVACMEATYKGDDKPMPLNRYWTREILEETGEVAHITRKWLDPSNPEHRYACDKVPEKGDLHTTSIGRGWGFCPDCIQFIDDMFDRLDEYEKAERAKKGA